MANLPPSGVKRTRTWNSDRGDNAMTSTKFDKLPRRWHEEVGSERRVNLSSRVDSIQRAVREELDRYKADNRLLRKELSALQKEFADYKQKIEPWVAKVDQMYALTLEKNEELTPVLDDIEAPPPIDQRISRVFRGIEIPLRELDLFENDRVFLLECSAEKERIDRQVESAREDKKLNKFSAIFEKEMENERFTVVDGVETDGEIFANLEGTRHANEDRSMEFSFIFREQPVVLRGVFDGHGGSFAANYCCETFEETLRECWKEFVREGKDYEIANALITTFVRLDAAHRLAVLKHHSRRPTPGTTACVSLKMGEKFYIANAGDSRAVLCSSNPDDARQLSYDFKGSDSYAQQTVKERGGEMIEGRVAYNGRASLAVTRAIGDEYLRGKNGNKPISPRPGVVVLDLSKLEDRSKCTLLLMSDGISDVAKLDAMARQVNRLREKGVASIDVSRALVSGAKLAGSIDDITVGTVFL